MAFLPQSPGMSPSTTRFCGGVARIWTRRSRKNCSGTTDCVSTGPSGSIQRPGMRTAGEGERTRRSSMRTITLFRALVFMQTPSKGEAL